jgi:hypothetical protein
MAIVIAEWRNGKASVPQEVRRTPKASSQCWHAEIADRRRQSGRYTFAGIKRTS